MSMWPPTQAWYMFPKTSLQMLTSQINKVWIVCLCFLAYYAFLQLNFLCSSYWYTYSTLNIGENTRVSSSIFYHCSLLPLHIGVLIYYSRGYANCLENALDLNFSIWSCHRWRFTCTWFVCGERSWLHWIGSRRSSFSKVMRGFFPETRLCSIWRCRLSAAFFSIFQTGCTR